MFLECIQNLHNTLSRLNMKVKDLCKDVNESSQSQSASTAAVYGDPALNEHSVDEYLLTSKHEEEDMLSSYHDTPIKSIGGTVPDHHDSQKAHSDDYDAEAEYVAYSCQAGCGTDEDELSDSDVEEEKTYDGNISEDSNGKSRKEVDSEKEGSEADISDDQDSEDGEEDSADEGSDDEAEEEAKKEVEAEGEV